MYSGTDVDISRSGNLVRRVLGLPLSFGKWEGNSFIKNFDSQQMRFLASNEHSALIIPPLTEGNREYSPPVISVALLPCSLGSRRSPAD